MKEMTFEKAKEKMQELIKELDRISKETKKLRKIFTRQYINEQKKRSQSKANGHQA